MKKHNILLICGLCFLSISGFSQDPPNKPLPDPPVEEPIRPDKPLPLPPPDKPLPEEPRAWTSATPSKEADREKNKWQRDIDKKWFHGHQGFNISFRHIIGKNVILASDGVSNWFAACGTLSGLYDQVQISQQEVIAKQGYWDQFKQVYGRKDVSIFNDFYFSYMEIQIDENSAYDLALIMDYVGPFVLISKEVDVAMVVAEIDYSTVGLHPYRVYTFNPASQDLAKGKSSSPVYGKTNYDRTLIEYRSMLYRLRAHNNQGPASVYLVINGDFDRSTGVNLRAVSDQKHALMREVINKYKNR